MASELWKAANDGDLEQVKYLISNGADINKRSEVMEMQWVLYIKGIIVDFIINTTTVYIGW